MSIESEVFKKSYANFNKIKEYGFEYNNKQYKFTRKFMENSFRADIVIDDIGNVSGKVYDLDINDEYINFRIENNVGEFVNTIREEYEKILLDIREKCFDKEYFLFPQSNTITKYIIEKYGDKPEFLWENLSDSAVFKNEKNGKWYGIIMDVDKSKIDIGTGKVEIIDVKAKEKDINELVKRKGFYPGYHMNKKNWITIVLDDTVSNEEIFKLIDNSYNMTNTPNEWIVPANPKYYDVVTCFDNKDVIEWKQSSNIHIGDIVYIYVASPYSCILYKCRAVEVDIPYEYCDKNLSMNRIIKLQLLKKYKETEITFSKLTELGIKAIRGPRKISSKISKSF